MRSFLGLLTLAYFLLHAECEGQNYSVYNSYCINPFLYNPAEAASSFTYVNFNHRKQWVGVEGSPTVTTATFTTLIDQSRTGLGVKVSSFTRGILETNDFLAAYVHGIPVNKNNVLYMAVAAGALSNNIDLTSIDDSDPALTSHVNNNIQPGGQFGLLYKTKSGINLGLSLPQLFKPEFNQHLNFDVENFAITDNIIASLYYKRKVDGKLVSRTRRGVRSTKRVGETYAPLEFYAVYKHAKNGLSQAEGTVKLNLSPNVWIGSIYRVNYGFAGLAGFAVKNFMFNYSYEAGNSPESYFSTGTHEFHCAIRIGKEKKLRRIIPTLHSKLNAVVPTQQHSARFQQLTEEDDYTTEARKKYYVVVKTVSEFSFADQLKQKLISEKFNAEIVFDPVLKKFHVYVFESQQSSEAFEEARNLKNYTKLKSARVVIIDIKKSKQR